MHSTSAPPARELAAPQARQYGGMTTTALLPPTPEQLLAVVHRTDTPDDGLTLLHLATPTNVVVPIGADRTPAGWRLGPLTVPDTGDILGDVLGLVMRTHQEGHRYLDLSTCDHPARFVKVLRSGTRQVAFGADLLVRGPQVVGELDVPPSALVALLELWQDRPDIAAAGVVELGEAPYLVEGGPSYLLLSRAA